jgi:hypothetical protein
MFVPVEFGYQHLEFSEVGHEFFLALLHAMEFGASGRYRIRIAEGGFEDADDVVRVVQLERSILDEWQYLRLGTSFQPVEGVTHP